MTLCFGHGSFLGTHSPFSYRIEWLLYDSRHPPVGLTETESLRVLARLVAVFLHWLDGLHVSHFASSLVAWDHQRILDCGCFIGTVEEDEGGEGLEDMETFESDEKMLMAGGLEEKGLIQGQIGL
ncbi:hypothetical protein V6N13_072960 [Hibiscus sabdariffa]